MADYKTRLEDAIIKAHDAGDTEAAQMLADELNKWKPKQTLSRTDKVLKGVKDPIDAGAQLLTKMLPDSVVNAGNAANNWLADKTGLFPKLPTKMDTLITGGKEGVDGLIERQERDYQAKRQAQGESGLDGYRAIGNIVSPANLAIASKIPMAGGLAKTVAGGAGLSAATVPVLEGDFWTEKAKQAAVGGAFAPVGNALARVVSPKASVDKGLQLLKKEGVTPTIGQTMGGVANRMEEKAVSIPVVGDMIRSARNNANNQFETSAFNRALNPIGQSLPKGLKGNEAVAYTKSVLNDKYDDVLTKIGTITPDKDYLSSINSLESIVQKAKIPNERKMDFENALDMIKQTSDDNGVMTSEGYKMLESELGRISKDLFNSKNLYERQVIAPAIKQVKTELKSLLKRQAGSLSDDLDASNKAWANFTRLEDAASKIGTDGGSFTPAQLQSSVKSLGGKKQFASGNALMQDLSSVGKSTLGNVVPNSGTADRLMLGGGALGGAYALDPLALTGLLGASAMYSKPAQSILNSAMMSRPDFAIPAAQFIRQNGKYIAPAGVASLLNQQ